MTRFTLDDLASIISARANASASASYTKSLLDAGKARAAKKLGEEAVEVVIAAMEGDAQAITRESADLLYHLLVVLHQNAISLADVYAELEHRTGQSGHAEKAARGAAPLGGFQLAQPREISVQTAPWDNKHGVCAQDFETSIQAYLSPSHLRGLLNFSALWNEVTYVYDTAIGDNPHLIGSYQSRPPGNNLYNTLTEFVREGIVQCLFREKVTVGGVDLKVNPQTADLYAGWRHRDKDRKDNFTTQIFDDARDGYNKNIDRLLFEERPYAVMRYDPDKAKKGFRQLIRDGIEQQGPLWPLISKLPPDLRKDYERICAENKFFTTVDLWSVIKDRASDDRSIEELLVMQGYINQQALAESIGSGVSGSNWGRGHSWRPNMLSEVANTASVTQPRTVDELLECAEFSLSAPALEILALLSPDEIIQLRDRAKKTVFGTDGTSSQDSQDIYRMAKDAIQDYWSHVCDYLYSAYPKYTQERTKLFVFFEDKWPGYKQVLRHPLIAPFVEVSVEVGVSQAAPAGTGGILKRSIRKVASRLIYQPNDAFRDLEEMQPRLWTPKAAWVSSVSDSTNVLKAQN